MPIETTPDTETKYYLIAFDAEGNERTDDPDGLMSDVVMTALRAEPVTDLFFLSHGWQGDIPSARIQYNKWIDSTAKYTIDRDAFAKVRPPFNAFTIGFHWPSLAWGDEELSSGNVSFVPGASPLDDLVNKYAARLADTPGTREALRTIFTFALSNIAPDSLPPEVRSAYFTLDSEVSLGSRGEGADPGADREPFNPDRVYDAAFESLSFGSSDLGGLLAPLRALTFWKMKDRAMAIGESAGYQLLWKIQQATGNNVRIHLMGHSFGCIVVSATLAGPKGRGQLIRPVQSLALVQGALSLWSYCSEIPFVPDRVGYFRSIFSDGKVQGPVITTISEKDSAVGRFYPIGAGVRGDVQFAPRAFPKYGGVGSFGARGPGLDIVDLQMQPIDVAYQFAAGKFYNLESTRYICDGGGSSGAHSDIAKPEVAHAIMSAAQ
jgi:hypothetical protein